MTTNLYEEAIADAKKIREVAEENAKKAILEAVTPKIREFIEEQILEQDAEKDEEKDDEKSETLDKDVKESVDEKLVELDESAIKALMNLIGDDEIKLSNGSRDLMDLALREAVSRLSSSERGKLFEIAQGVDESVESLNSRDLSNIKENDNMSREKYYEVDLNALREAVDEMSAMHEEEEALPDDMPDEANPDDALLTDLELDADLGGAEGGDGVELPDDLAQELLAVLQGELDDDEEEMPAGDLEDLDAEGGEEEQLDEVFEIDPAMLRQELNRVRRQIQEAKGKALAHEKGGIAKDMEHHFGGKGSANVKGGDFGGGKPGKDVLSEMRRVLRNQKQQNDALQTKLTKYRSAVDTLREQLEELNLFNAKLLYVNKLLQNKQISESQKRSIVQALDEAKDLREAKVLYKSLTESFSQSSGSKKPLTESRNLGSSSKTTRSASSAQASTEVDRWARLAGLK